MFECIIEQGDLFRKIITAISDLVQDGNFQIDGNAISFQGMDSSHVSLVSMLLKKDGFNQYRCDRDITLGIRFDALNKVLKCMGNKDKLALKCQDNPDSIFLLFESENGKTVSNFELKLMDIDAEVLGIPNTQYQVNVTLPSQRFQKIIRDLSAIGDSVTIAVSKDGVKFSVFGDMGSGSMTLKGAHHKKNVKAETNGKEEADAEMSENGVHAVDEDEDDEKTGVIIQMEEPVTQTFALKYLANFTKATTVSSKVLLSLGSEVPLRVEYQIDSLGEIAYYLAPKIDEDGPDKKKDADDNDDDDEEVSQ